MDVRGVLLTQASAIDLYHDHGIDVTSTPTWEIDRRSDVVVELLGSDPPLARIEIEVDGNRLGATVDETASAPWSTRLPRRHGRRDCLGAMVDETASIESIEREST